MDAFLMMKGARKIVAVCAAVRSAEKVVVVADSAMLEIADVLAAAACEREAEVVVTVMEPPKMDGAEPPRAVVEAMKAADVVILCVSYSIRTITTVMRAFCQSTSGGYASFAMYSSGSRPTTNTPEQRTFAPAAITTLTSSRRSRPAAIP